MKTRAAREREAGRAASVAAGTSFQCARCDAFYDGPDKDYAPGRQVASSPTSGDMVSHGYCDDCLDEAGMSPEIAAELDAKYGPGWRERLATAASEAQAEDDEGGGE